MNYQESSQILEKVKKAKKILVNCHKSPDPDSFGSALAIYGVLRNMGKEVRIICPSKFEADLTFLEDFGKIEVIDFKNFDFSGYDLFLALDSSSYDRVTGSKNIKMPNIEVIVIDHHRTAEKWGVLNVLDENVTSTCELLYKIFEDWGMEIDKKMATAILTGIIGDTGAFQYPNVGPETFKIAQKLMEKGANKDEIIFGIYRNLNFKVLKFWGEVLSKMQIDEEGKFVWSAIPYEKYVELGSPLDGRETAASQFAQVVKGIDFGMVMVEQEKGKLLVSLRSRTGVDTSQIALALSGGGHVYASGGRVEGLSFDQAVEKVLATARKFAKEK